MDRNQMQMHRQIANIRKSLFDQYCEYGASMLFVGGLHEGHVDLQQWQSQDFESGGGYLDEQFVQLEELQDNSNPNFVEEVVTLFYRDSARFLYNLDQALEKRPLDFSKLDSLMHQFKGSSSSIGAKKVKIECTHFRDYCNARNAEGCKRTFQHVKKEYTTLKKKLEAYFQMSRQTGPVERACRPR